MVLMTFMWTEVFLVVTKIFQVAKQVEIFFIFYSFDSASVLFVWAFSFSKHAFFGYMILAKVPDRSSQARSPQRIVLLGSPIDQDVWHVLMHGRPAARRRGFSAALCFPRTYLDAFRVRNQLGLLVVHASAAFEYQAFRALDITISLQVDLYLYAALGSFAYLFRSLYLFSQNQYFQYLDASRKKLFRGAECFNSLYFVMPPHPAVLLLFKFTRTEFSHFLPSNISKHGCAIPGWKYAPLGLLFVNKLALTSEKDGRDVSKFIAQATQGLVSYPGSLCVRRYSHAFGDRLESLCLSLEPGVCSMDVAFSIQPALCIVYNYSIS